MERRDRKKINAELRKEKIGIETEQHYTKRERERENEEKERRSERKPYK